MSSCDLMSVTRTWRLLEELALLEFLDQPVVIGQRLGRPAYLIERVGEVEQRGVAAGELRIFFEQRSSALDRARIPLGPVVLNADAELVLAEPVLAPLAALGLGLR